MNLPKLVPSFTTAKTSPVGKLNAADLEKIGRNMLVFLTPTILLYLSQLMGALSDHTALVLSDLRPSPYVVGAFEGYVIATIIDYLKKLNNK